MTVSEPVRCEDCLIDYGDQGRWPITVRAYHNPVGIHYCAAHDTSGLPIPDQTYRESMAEILGLQGVHRNWAEIEGTAAKQIVALDEAKDIIEFMVSLLKSMVDLAISKEQGEIPMSGEWIQDLLSKGQRFLDRHQ